MVSAEVRRLRESQTTIDVTTAVRIARRKHSAMLRALRVDQVQSLRLESRLLIAAAPFRRRLGLDGERE